ncbi:MAG: T9SS type A sorting domain-containing protein [Bacteroidia bacterium]
MRTLKLTLTALVVCTLIASANAQIIYRSLNPDPTQTMPAESLGKMPLYVDDDTSVDATLIHNNYPSFGFWNVAISPTDTINPKVEFLYNSNLPKSPVGDYYILPLDLNQNIGATASYAFKYPQIGDSYNSNFRDAGDKYIGFRMRSGTAYKYGWMKVNLSGTGSMTFVIKELAYQNTENTAIKAGQTFGVGIRHIAVDEHAFTFYPNPVKTTLHIQSEKDVELSSIRIYSIDGKCVKELGKPDLTMHLDLSALPKGAYFIELIQGGNTISRELFLKEE